MLTNLLYEEKWDEPCDILGTICHELQLNDRHDGRHFKPDHICRLMSMLVNRAGDGPDNLDWKGKITDPACGSGSLILGMVWDMKQKNFDYRHRILFIAQDIDIQCVWMAYIQLTLYQVPAVVMHGNTRTQEEWSRWFTPYAIMQAQASEPEDAEGAGQ